MQLPEFKHYRPETLEEALALTASLQNENVEYSFYGGGTDVVPAMKRGLFKPQAMVALSAIPDLSSTYDVSDTLRIGSLATLNQINNDPLINEHFPIIAETARKIATPQIRSQATIGGNILVDNRCVYFNQADTNRENHSPCFKAGGDVCHFIPGAGEDGRPLCRSRCVSDLAPVLMLLGARLCVVNNKGEREIAIADLYPEDGMDRRAIAEDEILTSIVVALRQKTKIAYEKLRIRNAIDFASLGVAVSVGEKKNIKVCIIGLEPLPVYFEFSKDESNDSNIEKMLKNISPLKQDILPPLYRKNMIYVLVQRMLEKMI